jgi:hypothetical protein
MRLSPPTNVARAFECSQRLAVGYAPDVNGFGAHGTEPLTIRGEDDNGDGLFVALQLARQPSVGNLPQSDSGVPPPSQLPPPAEANSRLSGERNCNFQPYEVVRVFQVPLCRFFFACQPTRADQDYENLASADLLAYNLVEIVTRLDTVGIPKDLVRTEASRKSVVQADGIASGVLTAIADEDSGQFNPSTREGH